MVTNFKIMFLYREIMPYNLPVLRSLVNVGAEIKFVYIETNKNIQFVPVQIGGVEFIKKSQIDYKDLENLTNNFDPEIVFISDRTISDYNKIGIKLRKKIPVIGGNDTPWYGGKQWINVLISFYRHKRFFSHMLVAGMRQFEYAKKLGFSNEQIIWPLYSADTARFNKIPLSISRFNEARDILFVGRFNEVKGIDYLLEAWSRVLNKKGGKLHLVGNGVFLNKFKLDDDILVHNFSDQNYLVELALKCKCFVLPSIFEPWGVVVHEFTAAGLPIIVTDVCGSAPHLVKNNFNGYIVPAKSAQHLEKSITNIFNHSPEKLFQMGTGSRELSKSISPELVAAAILSTLKK